MKIAVVGHMVSDEIVAPNGKVKKALGGTAYNLAALGTVAKEATIYPVCRIGSEARDDLVSVFSKWPSIDLSTVMYSKRPNVVHRLTYNKDGSRREWNSAKQGWLTPARIPKDAAAVLINFISGCDMKISDLRVLRYGFKGLIYFDLHSLTLGLNRKMMRYFRAHPRWRDYLSSTDMVQMNLEELEVIVGRKMEGFKEIAGACKELLDAGPRQAVVTLGRNGVILSDGQSGTSYHVPPVKIHREVDPTGCGDTLSATFVYNYLRTGNLIKSIEAANHRAAAKATFSGLAGFMRLEKILEKIGPLTRASKLK